MGGQIFGTSQSYNDLHVCQVPAMHLTILMYLLTCFGKIAKGRPIAVNMRSVQNNQDKHIASH